MQQRSLLLPLLLLLAFTLGAAHSTTQENLVASPDPNNPVGANMKTPPDWNVRLDSPAEIVIGDDATAVDIFFVSMTPGLAHHERTASDLPSLGQSSGRGLAGRTGGPLV